jgi:Na+-translocating ferredoxin:NAD+ oxidoreductase RnfE subunit
MLPPGAFLTLGLLLALRNVVRSRVRDTRLEAPAGRA